MTLAAPLRSLVQFPMGMNFGLEGKKKSPHLSHTKVQVCSRPISRGCRCRCIWVGSGIVDFLELPEKFIFLMKHHGDVSPPWLEFFFKYFQMEGVYSFVQFLLFEMLAGHCWLHLSIVQVLGCRMIRHNYQDHDLVRTQYIMTWPANLTH